MNDPLLPVEYPAARVAPAWGIGAILGLVGLLGFVLFQRLSEEDRSWARWEKHELSGVVLGQTPVQESGRNVNPSGPRSSADVPQWAQAKASQRPVRETASTSSSAPVQQETAESGDPFGAIPANQDPRLQSQQAAPRRLFHEESASASLAHAPAAEERSTATPKSLDFAVSPSAQEKVVSGQPGQARFQRVQQAAAEEESAESLFPGPAPAGQMPIQSVGAEGNGLPSVERLTPPGGIPSAPQEISLDPFPTPTQTPAPSQAPMPVAAPQQSTGLEPQPTLSMPESAPRSIPSLPQPNVIPAQPLQSQSPGLPSLGGAPAATPAPAPQRMPQAQPFQMQTPNDPIPSAGLAQPPKPVTVSTPAATVKPDEIYQVQSGDNYWTISRRYYGSARFFSSLAEYNKHRIPAPEKMKPGMYVLVPDVEVLHQRYPHLTGGGPRDPAETAPPGFFVDANGQPCYRVGKGDTLTDIAQSYLGRSSRWIQIQEMNQDRLENGKALKIGLVLRLPSDASQVSLAPASVGSR